MKLTLTEDINLTKKYCLEIEMGDYLRANFDEWDRKLLADCDSEDATIADKLLGLETIARRIEQARQKKS